MIASFFALVPVRIHNIVGMPLMEAKGKKLLLLKFVERLTYLFATKLLTNSFGLQKYIANNLTKKQVTVVAKGSINGVNSEYFKNTYTDEEKNHTRNSLKIDKDAFVLIFVGRIVRDKGINELIEAFSQLKIIYPKLTLLLVGDYEEDLNPIKSENKIIIDESRDIISVGFQEDIRKYLGVADLFVLPSYREGLPNSLIEAGSFGLPLLATDINGCNEIIIENETGILVEVKSTENLKNGMMKFLDDFTFYNKIKENVRQSILSRYNQVDFLKELRSEIEKSL
ncbi:glycosyltransferase [Sulfurimonas sp. SAG-AH-194-C20]|nr:glycosyltransferase [Sulfurimonas sp. SAG-AH-194-C20]